MNRLGLTTRSNSGATEPLIEPRGFLLNSLRARTSQVRSLSKVSKVKKEVFL